MDSLLALADEIGSVTGTLERKLNGLAEEIVLLRAELHELRGERDAEVIDLPSWPMRDRNAA